MSKSKNKEWKESGSTLSFKDWMRQDLNNTVQKTVSNISGSGYSNVCGSSCTAANTYKDYTTGSVLGVNKYIVISGVAVVVLGIAYGIWHKSKNKTV